MARQTLSIMRPKNRQALSRFPALWNGDVMDQRERIAALFDRVADTYDRVGVDLFQPIAARLVTEVAPRVGERVADIGCGRGAALLRLASAVGPSGAAVGLDLAPQMVAAAAASAAQEGLSVEAMVGDAQDPDLPTESFDIVTASLVLFFLPEPVAALRAWGELLVNGGRIAVSTFGPNSTAWEPVDAVFEPYLPPGMRDARTTGKQGPFGSDAGVERLLVDAGFADVCTAVGTVSVRFDDADHWHRWTMSTGQRGMWEMVPEAERAAVRASASRLLDNTRRQNADHRIGFDQSVRYTLGRRRNR